MRQIKGYQRGLPLAIAVLGLQHVAAHHPCTAPPLLPLPQPRAGKAPRAPRGIIVGFEPADASVAAASTTAAAATAAVHSAAAAAAGLAANDTQRIRGARQLHGARGREAYLIMTDGTTATTSLLSSRLVVGGTLAGRECRWLPRCSAHPCIVWWLQ